MTLLRDIFGDADDGSAIFEAIVAEMLISNTDSTMEILLEGSTDYDEKDISALSELIKRTYGIEKLHIRIEYGENKCAEEMILDKLKELYPSLCIAVDSASAEFTGTSFGFRMSESWSCRKDDICDAIRTVCRELDFGSVLPVPSFFKEKVSFEQRREETIKKIMDEAPKLTSKEYEAIASGAYSNRNKPKKKTMSREEKTAAKKPLSTDAEKIIFGFPRNFPVTSIGQLETVGEKVAVRGEIFSTELRKIQPKNSDDSPFKKKSDKKEEKTRVKFEIYDGTGSIRVSSVVNDKDVKNLKDRLGIGKTVLVQGTYQFSEWDKMHEIKFNAIVEEEPVMRTDDAPEKRVELHLHTTMSANDGLCDPKKVISLAQSMGHRAIAITDHGVVQAFPEAMNAARALKKAGKEIKVIYGVEAYCVNDLEEGIVKGYSDKSLDDEIVVFDLETTGLTPRTCEIIEIAADKVKDGEIIERFHTYVKPKGHIPFDITRLTGIKDDTVANSPPISVVLPEFLEFCGDRPLCAHNADFDVSFIREACRNQGIERDFCSIDTVELSRALLPKLKKHRLNDLASHFRFVFNHHRADDDTEVLARIFFKLIELMKERDISLSIAELNANIQALSEKQGDLVPKGRAHHLIILVKTQQGLRNLYEMISASHLKHFKRYPLIPMSLLMKKREGLILGSACEAGELFSAIVQDRPWDELLRIARIFDFLEIQPIGNNMFMLRNGTVSDAEQLRDFNRTVIRLGEELGKPVCATGDVHFIEPEDYIFREIIMTGNGFDDAGNQVPLYYRTTGEMLDEFSYLGEKKALEVVVKNPNMIADMCEEIIPLKDGTYPPSIENSAEEINNLARSKAAELYGDELPKIVRDRLEMELNSIIGHGYDIMYIIAQKLVKKSLDDGYLVGSRGSVGSSVVAYFTGITEVNALPPHYRCPECKHSIFDIEGDFRTGVDLPDMVCPICGAKMDKDGFDIPFATFMGFKGDKTPDIDLNFSGEYQAQAHRETINLFGEENVFRAGTISAIKSRTAYGYVMKYFEQKKRDEALEVFERGAEFTDEEKYFEERSLIADGDYKLSEEEIRAKASEINRLVAGCTGIKRTTGQHPGGLIVLPRDRDIHEFTPVQHPADAVDSTIITTHFDYHSIHDNLLKLDLLGHDDPTMIRMLEDLSGLDSKKIPLDDPETMRIFTSIDPLGIESDDILEQTGAAAIPEFGTKNVRGMLVETQPTTFDGLLRISGLSHGTNVWRNNAQDYIKEGVATLNDVICVRDDITLYLMRMGLDSSDAFTISESVRKGKGLKPEWETLMREHGVPDWYIDSCNKIEYMFPRAHAVAYVMMAYRIAWFKVHMPLVFYAAYFSIRAGGFDAGIMTKGDQVVSKRYRDLRSVTKRTAIEEDTMSTLEICHEFYKRGFGFENIDVYRSDVKRFRIEGNSLIPPFTSLPGVGEAAAQAIVEAREKGEFMSIEDMVSRCDKVSKAVAEVLDSAGAFGDLPKTNQLSLFD